MIYFFLGLLLGIAFGWVQWGRTKTSKPDSYSENQTENEQEFVDINLSDFIIPKPKAIKYVRNYLIKRKELSNTIGDSNTNYLFISIPKLVEIINKWHGGKKKLVIDPLIKNQVDTIRIYPMIYSRNHEEDISVRNMLNLCLVPVSGKNEILQKNTNGEDGYFFFHNSNTASPIENEIGQCPPQCISDATLLNEAEACLGEGPDSD